MARSREDWLLSLSAWIQNGRGRHSLGALGSRGLTHRAPTRRLHMMEIRWMRREDADLTTHRTGGRN
jgi:hypothetical protein